MKNRRGDIPLTVLIIGVFAVCTLAIISFIYTSYKLNKSLVGVEIMEKANAQIEENNLDHIYLYEKVKKLSFGEGFNLFKDKIIFSVEYNP
jgi:hypothetical protein